MNNEMFRSLDDSEAMQIDGGWVVALTVGACWAIGCFATGVAIGIAAYGRTR